jgi:GntR family transcriptional repressor for pyruvate dehydrogenase complex
MQKQVQRRLVYTAVMEQIRDDIAEGRLHAGDRLESVSNLAKHLGVGQSSVREAVRVLSYMGLLRVKHGGGIFVTERLSDGGTVDPMESMAEVERASLWHLMELRLAIEPAAARGAAERATPDERVEIMRRCDEVQEELRRNIEFLAKSEFQEDDVAFHLAIVRASHNPLFVDTLERVHTQLRIGRYITSHVPPLVDSALRFHPQIAQAILAQDAVRAENYARSHVEDVIWWLEQRASDNLAVAGKDCLNPSALESESHLGRLPARPPGLQSPLNGLGATGSIDLPRGGTL